VGIWKYPDNVCTPIRTVLVTVTPIFANLPPQVGLVLSQKLNQIQISARVDFMCFLVNLKYSLSLIREVCWN
jgi:hypothetical protein